MHGTIIYTLRQFRLSPVFTAAATLTLAVGIGGTTAIFTLIHAVMLRSLTCFGPGAPLSHRRRGRTAASKAARKTGGECFLSPLFERLKGGNAGGSKS